MSDSEDHLSSDDDFQSHAHLFKSSLDIGSHFIDIQPENELIFYNREGTLLSQLTVKNVTSKAYVAFFVSIELIIYITMIDLIQEQYSYIYIMGRFSSIHSPKFDYFHIIDI